MPSFDPRKFDPKAAPRHRALARTLAIIALMGGGMSCEATPAAEPTCGVVEMRADAGAEPPFVEVTEALGISFEREHVVPYTMPDSMGGGVCMFDVDGDRDLDLYFTARAPRSNRLYRNDGGRFTNVTEAWRAGPPGDTMGCLAFDADSDGDLDLLLTNWGPSVLLRNEGRFFSDATAETGLVADNLSSSATAGDMDNDGDMDLFIGRYVDPATCASCPEGGKDECAIDPHHCTPLRSLMFENRRGRFVEVGMERGVTRAEPTFATVFVDFDQDGDLDLYKGNDAGRLFPDRMYLNDGTGHFTDRASEMGLAWDATEHGGDTMGVAIGDYDRDGIFDLASTNIDERPTLLFRCRAGLSCVDARQEGISLDATLGTLGWGVGFIDVDNDGWIDLFNASGQDYSENAAQRSHLFWNRSGRFEHHTPGAGDALAVPGIDRGAAFGDLDGDGGVDVVLGPNAGRARVLHNRAARGHYLTVALDTLSAGATVTLLVDGQTLRAPVVVGGSFLGSSSPWVSFGLGRACSATVTVRWLGGRTVTLPRVAADQTIFVARPRS